MTVAPLAPTVHGRTLAITEAVVAVTDPDSEAVVADIEAWADDRDLAFAAVEADDAVEEVYDPDLETLGVAVGGDGTFLEAVRAFAPRDVPVVGINTGTVAFLTRIAPGDARAALTETVRGRATVAQRQQFEVTAGDLQARALNDLVVRTAPPEDPTGRKISAVHVFLDQEYVGRYEGTGLVVSTPTGSTGISLSAGGPVHYPEDDHTLQVVPLVTHQLGVRPLVVGAEATVRLVPEESVDLQVDGGRDHARLEADEVVTVSGQDCFADIVRTSYDDGFFGALAGRLGWGIRDGVVGGGPRIETLAETPVEPDLLERARQIAVEAAHSAGEPLRERHGQVESVEFKTDKADIVTEADYLAERIITTVVETEFPDHNVYSEESVQRDQGSAYTWVIDPLDGTGNFAHGNPNYAVSIALVAEGDPVMGVVYNPETRETFSAVAGGVPREGDTVISTTGRDRLDESMLLSGYDPDGSFLVRFYQATRGVRRLGSAALNLCYLASGSADAIWEYDTHPWDVAAGLVIARAAGAEITGAGGDPYEFGLEAEGRRELVGTNGPLHDAVLEHLQGADPDLELGGDPGDGE